MATTAAAAEPPRKRRFRDVLRALGQPRVGLMLALGLSSGLPFMLIGNTLGFWLAEDKIKLSEIGYLSWAGLPYLVKFLWGAVVDRVPAPIISRMGRRRSWMLISQIGVGLGLVGMAACDPKTQLGWLALAAVITGVFAATQDTVIDAWRIEIAADPDELGLLTASYTFGYRGALILTEAAILVVALALGWPLAYAIYGALMLVGIAATLLASEPARADAALERVAEGERGNPLKAVFDAVIEPFIAFFRAHGVAMAALMLGMITLYHLSDYMRGPMSNPYYVALHIPKTTIAGVRAGVGLAGGIVGIALGGLASLRFGNKPTLVLGAIIQPIGIGAFALLGWHGSDFTLFSVFGVDVTAFEVIMTFDSFAIGFSGITLVAYMSTLTSLGYTATQYALLTSALAWTGKILKGFSGDIVEGLQTGRSLLDAYALFYVLCAAIGVPAILLCIILARTRPKIAAPVV